MGYERLRVVKPLKQLIKTVELYTRHVAKDNRGQWRDAKMALYSCFGNLIRAAEVWGMIAPEWKEIVCGCAGLRKIKERFHTNFMKV